MTSRIDDRRQDPTIDRALEEKQRDSVKKETQKGFEKTMLSQKAGQAKMDEIIAQQQQGSGKQAKAAHAKAGATAKPAPAPATSHSKTKKTDEKKETQKEDAKLAKADKKREDTAIENAVKEKQDKDTKDQGFGSSSDEFFQNAAQIALQAGHFSPAPMPQVEATSKRTPIPDAVMNQLVSQVYVGVDKKGLTQFVIELKDGALGGGTMSVTSNKGKVSLKFSGLNDDAKWSLNHAKDDLKQRLGAKNLKLEEFELG